MPPSTVKKFVRRAGSAYYIAAIALLSVGCTPDSENPTKPGTMAVEFDNIYGGQDLALGEEYTNASGEQLRVDKLQYYISNISLLRPDGSRHTLPQDSSYFLVREAVPASRKLRLRGVPAGPYNGIEFMVGIDSLRSRMAPASRRGVLDIADEQTGQSMYWTWNSGYIHYKIEGRSPQSPQEIQGQKSFFYHIGGYGGTDSARTINNIRKIALSFPQQVEVKTGIEPEVHIGHDVKKVWDGPAVISIAANPMSHFSPWSANLANNYASSFTVLHVHQM